MGAYGVGIAKAQPRTQKAKSVVALKASGFDTPTHKIFQIEEFTGKNGVSYLHNLVGNFVRPCPMRPRHGFVDSRPVRTLSEAEQIVAETLAVEERAELIVMPFIEADYSAIWTPGMLVIGPKNDGATSGQKSRTIPIMGFPASSKNHELNKQNWIKALELAGVTESPYVEILWSTGWDDSGWLTQFVQLRNGPAIPQSIDYIPSKTKVKQVVVADGDLLAWESKVKEFKKGTVVYHPGGSLASHYAVHAVLNKIPVLISREPKVGEWLTPNTKAAEPNLEKIRAGFVYGATVTDDRANHQRIAAYLMLVGLHNTSVWLGKYDELLGMAMGFAYRLSVSASLGEYRHEPGRSRTGVSRNAVYNHVWDEMFTTATRTRFIKAIYSFTHNSNWGGSFGGPKWAAFAAMGACMYDCLVTGNVIGALEYFNQLVHAAHNGGWAFNKFIDEANMTACAENPCYIALRVAPFLYQAIVEIEAQNAQYFEYFKTAKTLDKETFDYVAAHDASKRDESKTSNCVHCNEPIECCSEHHSQICKGIDENYKKELLKTQPKSNPLQENWLEQIMGSGKVTKAIAYMGLDSGGYGHQGKVLVIYQREKNPVFKSLSALVDLNSDQCNEYVEFVEWMINHGKLVTGEHDGFQCGSSKSYIVLKERGNKWYPEVPENCPESKRVDFGWELR